MSPSELLRRYILLHNLGIETGEFEPLLQLFKDDAVMEFENPKIGEFTGIEIIRGIFRRQPPMMAIAIGEIVESDCIAKADYIIEDEPEVRQGYLSMEIDDDKIQKLYIGL